MARRSWWRRLLKTIIGDFNGDGWDDIGVHKNTNGKWYVALNSGLNSFNTATVWLTGFGSGSNYQALVGDFDGDGNDDVCTHNNTNGNWEVALSNGSNGFTNDGVWIYGMGTADYYIPVVGDFDGDGMDDACVHKNTNGSWYVALSTESGFGSSSRWVYGFGTADYYIAKTGFFDSDSKQDIGTHKNTNGSWYVAVSTGSSSFSPSSSSWVTGFGTTSDYRGLVGNFIGDSRDDIANHKITNGNWYVATNDNTETFYPTTNPVIWLSGWGTETGGSPKITSDEPEIIPTTFNLSQNYPNPFNPVTTISYSLTNAGEVKLEVFNILGQKVTTLVNEYQSAGQHSVSWAIDQQASGIYFYRLASGEAVETKKMVLLK